MRSRTAPPRLVLAALAALAALTALAGCGGDTEQGPPPGWDAELRLAELPDGDPDPRVLDVRLEARASGVEILPGEETRAFTYGGRIPGPLLRAKVGDTLRVRFSNALAEPTTIHWHGVRVPAEMDGAPGHSQPPIPPGGAFTYEFVLRDAGLFWYHPHVRAAAQVGAGLYGAILVEDDERADAGAAALGDEVVMVLGDVGLDEEGRLLPADAGGDLGTLFGREGQHILVNGKRRPTLLARSGRRQRWRLVNAAKSRYFQLELPGHTFTRIGGDGGRLERPVESERLLLAPGERADVLLVPRGEPGSEIALRWIPFDRGYGTADYRAEEDVLGLHFAPGSEEPAPLPALERAIERLDTSSATPVEARLTQATVDGALVLGINGVPMPEAEPFQAEVGETQVWTVSTEMDWAHPFHLHGFFFQVLGEDGAPERPLAWRDTVHVPARARARFAVRFDDRPGAWMFHCHVLDHEDAGMAGMLHVHPRGR